MVNKIELHAATDNAAGQFPGRDLMSLTARLAAVVVTSFVTQSALAQAPQYISRQPVPNRAPARFAYQAHARPLSVVTASDEKAADASNGTVTTQSGAPVGSLGHYPQLGAPLYPSPAQNIPVQTGATIITNQALAPHEMLYPHSYRAMYPPFFYKVKGGWIWTPFGMRSHDKWELQGTVVEVKYRSKRHPFSGFAPPRIR